MPQRLALVVIDLQNSYFEEPALAAVRDDLVARVNELIRAARAGGCPVVLARTEHARDRSTWTLNMLEDDEGFAFPGTAQAELLDGLDTAGGIDVVKTRDSAFHGTRLREVLRERDVGEVLLCGVSTHSCIAQSATTAFAENLHAAVARDAVASEAPELAAAMLDFLDDEMRQPILQQDDAVAVLRRGTLAAERPDESFEERDDDAAP